jgi:molybdenum-dependent DNA-binding transcriptional regulator ModE
VKWPLAWDLAELSVDKGAKEAGVKYSLAWDSVVFSVDKSSARAAVTRRRECGKLKNLPQ